MPASSNGQNHGAAATTVTGTLAADRVTLGGGAHVVTDDAGLTFDPATKSLANQQEYTTDGFLDAAFLTVFDITATGDNNDFYGADIELTVSNDGGSGNTARGLNVATRGDDDVIGVDIFSHGAGADNTALLIEDVTGATKNYAIKTGAGDVLFGGIQSFSDNAAAVTGGLAVGSLYRTGDVLKIVH